MRNSDFSQADLTALRQIDVRTVDPDTLADINEVNIDEKLPQEERLKEFVRQIGNPYCYKCGEAIIKVSFSGTSTLEDCIENYLKTF